MTSPPRTRPLLLVALAVAVLGAWLFTRWTGPDRESLVPVAEAWPSGRWHRLPSAVNADDDAEASERARLLSLPYAAGSRLAAGEATGVVRYDAARAMPGVNLYTSGHAPEVLMLDLEGRLLQRWRLDFGAAFPGRAPTADTAFFRTAALLPEGDVLALYQGGGLVRLDRAGRLRWALPLPVYNDVFVEPDGPIWSLTKAARLAPEVHPTLPILEDEVVAVDLGGRLERRFSLLAALRGTPHFAALVGSAGDVFHSNAVRVLDGALADRHPALAAGNLLVSIRQLDLLVVLDQSSGRRLLSVRGPWKRQHDPALLPNGRLLLFDNQGLAGRSRALEWDLASAAIAWQWSGEDAAPLDSPEAGSAQRLANGNTLITESERGRALEVTPAGEVVWEYVSPHRAGPNSELVATLFEVRRLARPSWLGDSSAGL